jgi:hypothetical protein
MSYIKRKRSPFSHAEPGSENSIPPKCVLQFRIMDKDRSYGYLAPDTSLVDTKIFNYQLI